MKHAHTRRLRRFEPLSRLGDYQVEPHEVDPRGWNVLSPDGRTVGEVKDLIVDTERMRARYLDVELDSSAFDLHDDPRVLVPVERAVRDGTHRRLAVEGLTADRVAELVDARDRHIDSFWERWWSGDRDPTRSTTATVSMDSPQHLHHDSLDRERSQQDLRRALENVRPGEQVRIPVVEEEIVVERRPVPRGQ